MPFYNLLKKLSSPLFLIIVIEILGVGMMMAGLVPRELALFLLGAFIFFATFAPPKQAVLFAVFSIPLYTALPITESFDSMASWRIIITILFLRSLWRNSWVLSFGSFSVRLQSDLRGFASAISRGSKSAKRQYPKIPFMGLGILIGMFFALGAVSLLVAQEPIIGIKKLIYLANIFALFFVINFVIQNKDDFLSILKYTFAGSLLTLAIGYAQFIAILFTPLYNFWQWWASTVIPIFYGRNLADLLSYSNTWFSYYENADPTLRIFSIFPDSHSFALFMILMLPMALTFFSRVTPPLTKGGLGGVIALILLAIIFSGTRGAWLGTVPVFLVLLFIFFRQTKTHIVKISLVVFLVFVLLLPVASQIQKIAQWRQGGQISDSTTFSRISTSFRVGELSNKGRIQIWKSTLSSIVKHPFLGVGIGNYPVVLKENFSATKQGASAHSLYLDIISEMGIFAGIVLLLIFFAILKRAIEVSKTNKDPVFAAFAGFLAIYFLWMMAYSVVDVVLLNDKVLLLFTVLTALLYSTTQNASLDKHSRL